MLSLIPKLSVQAAVLSNTQGLKHEEQWKKRKGIY